MNRLTILVFLSHDIPQHDEDINNKKDDRGGRYGVNVLHGALAPLPQHVRQILRAVRT